MSATNWRKCPKCTKLAAKKKLDLSLKLARAYGKVSEDEYLELLTEQQTPVEPTGRTLREDYELGIWNDVFEVSYSAYCSECGFTKKFETKEPLNIVI